MTKLESLIAERAEELANHGTSRRYGALTMAIHRARNPEAYLRKSRERIKTRYNSDPAFRAYQLQKAKEWRLTEAGKAFYRGEVERRKTDPQVLWKNRLNHSIKNYVFSARPEASRRPRGPVPKHWHLFPNHQAYREKLLAGYLRGEELDHIIPCCRFDLSTDEGRKACYALDNLQTLTKEANLSKGKK